MRKGITASLVLVSVLSGCGNSTSNTNAAKPQNTVTAAPQATSDTKSGTALAGGLLQPISDSWWHSVSTKFTRKDRDVNG